MTTDQDTLLFINFEKQAQKAREQILAVAGTGDVRISAWNFSATSAPHFDITYSRFPLEEKVQGRHLGEMAEELIRRIRFKQRQDQLQLTGPTIDG